MSFVDDLIEEGWLKTPKIIEAFQKIKREDFLPDNIKNFANLNEALPIGFNQTISQPLVVAFMLEQLQPKAREKILDIGSGSGWTTALLAQIVSQEKISDFPSPTSKQKGKIIAIEVIPQLKKFGEKNIAKYNFIKKEIVECICGDGSKGYEKEAPFDKILVSAAAERCFPSWKKQLKIGGRIVVPIGSSIWLFIKNSETNFQEIEYPGFSFVPLIIK